MISAVLKKVLGVMRAIVMRASLARQPISESFRWVSRLGSLESSSKSARFELTRLAESLLRKVRVFRQETTQFSLRWRLSQIVRTAINRQALFVNRRKLRKNSLSLSV